MTNGDITYRLTMTHPSDCCCIACEAAAEIARLRTELASAARQADYFQRDRDREQGDGDAARRERDEAQMLVGRILNEIDCRIEHGADSNGHLEGLRLLFGNCYGRQKTLTKRDQ